MPSPVAFTPNVEMARMGSAVRVNRLPRTLTAWAIQRRRKSLLSVSAKPAAHIADPVSAGKWISRDAAPWPL
jgi:hypothetical protein